MCLCFTVSMDVLEMPKNGPQIMCPTVFVESECMRAAERKYPANEKEKRSAFLRRWSALPKAVLANTILKRSVRRKCFEGKWWMQRMGRLKVDVYRTGRRNPSIDRFTFTCEVFQMNCCPESCSCINNHRQTCA